MAAMRCVLLMLVLGACADRRPPPPRDAAAACLAAIRAAGTEPIADELRDALTCERLYRDRRCADAWRGLATPDDPSEWIAAIDRLIPACRAACLRQSGGAPPRGCLAARDARDIEVVRELDRALHLLSGLPVADAEALAQRATLLALGVQQGIVIPIRPRDTDPPAPGEVRIQVDADGEIRVDGDIVTADELTEALTILAARRDLESATLAVAPDMPYERIIELMDKVRAAGIQQILFEVDQP